ncbi:hypothetical protein BAE44_0018211 [Dichanthelium oligosanthes]|uniref:NET domain-containing protein n=1 Tax=Dichanthelium oligosanthes TaxID=888268 RepID=A0A1E5V6I8_9POAL|nr:hypothetical protein BAE44_0018211 [Dichanthelium oligosanthes]
MRRPGPARGDGEMAQKLVIRRVIVGEHSAPGGKGGVLVRRDAFAVKRELFAVGKMSLPARRLLRKRLGSELDAVRDALRKAERLSCGAGATGAAAPARKDGRRSAAEAPVEEDGSRAAKRKKVSPFAEQRTGGPKRMRPDDRERLAGRLASLAAVLPDHVVAFLQNRRIGDADSRGDGGGIEKDVKSMKSGALFQLKMLLDKFAPESTPKSQGRAPPLVASGGSCLSHHQGAGGKLATVQEEEEEEVGVDICGGVSRIAIRDIAEEYGDLVEDIGVQLLSPLQRKYVDLAEQGEYVDICGDASPVVFPNKAGDTSSNPSLSSSDSDSSSSDSDSSSSSDSDFESDPDKSVNSRSPPAIVPKEKDTYAQSAEPAAEAVHIAVPEDVQDQCAPPVPTVPRSTRRPPAPAVLLPKANDTCAQPPAPAPETVQIAEQEELQDQCALPAPTVHPVINSSPPGPAALPKENDTNTQPPKPAPETVQIGEPEELQDQCVAPTATVHPIAGSAPPTAVLPEENGTSSQPPEVAPVAAQIAEPEELQHEGAAPAPAPAPINDMNDLVTAAHEAAERRRRARRVLLEVERAALPDERVHPRDMELLGIAAFEHVTSTVQDARTAQPQVNDGGGLRVWPGQPSVLQQLGLFLKADDGSEEEEQQQQPLPRPEFCHVIDMEVEDGEIR